jgi:hypothetical protein
MVLPSSGLYTLSHNAKAVAAHVVSVTVMTAKSFSAQDTATALPLAILIADALQSKPTLNETVDGLFTIAGDSPIQCSYGPITWGGSFGIGWTINVNYYVESVTDVITALTREMDLDGAYAYVDAIQEIAHLCQTVPGIESAFYEPPDQVTVFPFGVVFPQFSEFSDEDATTFRGIHSFVVELHTARNDGPYDVDNSILLGPAMAEVLLNNIRLNEAVDTIGDISYFFGPLGYGNVSTLGWSITVNGVKQRLDIS